MTTAPSIVCGSCGSEVPYGRLSCPSCGDLLASVAGGTRARQRPETDGPAASDAVPPPPGAYVPPPIAGGPARIPEPDGGPLALSGVGGPAAPARAWGARAEPAATVGSPTDATGPEGTTARPGLLAAERRGEAIGWLAIAGGDLAAVGFLLPWGVSMIGATGTDYLARWGLAGPFHPLVVLATLVVVVGAIVPNPVPAWLRLGIPATVVGTLTIGLAWPYLFGFTTAGPGAIAAGVGALVFTAAGVASLVADRHGRSSPLV
ncbi:MAG: hypothetical protein ACLGIJ_03805 [Candidatus Limnocylindria bacterium]